MTVELHDLPGQIIADLDISRLSDLSLHDVIQQGIQESTMSHEDLVQGVETSHKGFRTGCEPEIVARIWVNFLEKEEHLSEETLVADCLKDVFGKNLGGKEAFVVLFGLVDHLLDHWGENFRVKGSTAVGDTRVEW